MSTKENKEYLPIRAATLRANLKFTFDLYVKVAGKMILYVRKGDEVDREKIDKMEKMKVNNTDRLFVLESEYKNYEAFIVVSLDEAVTNPAIPVEQKIEIVEDAAMSAIESMEKDPINKGSYKLAEKSANSLRAIVSENPTALKKLFGKTPKDTDIVLKHCLNVCALATEFAKEFGHTEEELENLGTAALLHDMATCHYKEDERTLFKKKADLFTPDDRRIYKLHPKDTVDKLRDKPFVTKEVITLILNHEEKLSGNGLNGVKKLTPLEQILSLCNMYDKKVTVSGMSYFDAMKEVFSNEVGNYDLKYIKKFKEFIEKKGLLDK